MGKKSAIDNILQKKLPGVTARYVRQKQLAIGIPGANLCNGVTRLGWALSKKYRDRGGNMQYSEYMVGDYAHTMEILADEKCVAQLDDYFSDYH